MRRLAVFGGRERSRTGASPRELGRHESPRIARGRHRWLPNGYRLRGLSVPAIFQFAASRVSGVATARNNMSDQLGSYTAALLRHANASTTLGICAHVLATARIEAVNAVDGLLRASDSA
jgi:hypothetical protein